MTTLDEMRQRFEAVKTLDDATKLKEMKVQQAQINETTERAAKREAMTSGPVEALDMNLSKVPPRGPRPSIIHRIKSTSPHFEAVASTRKHAELRKDDRGYAEGDYLVINHCTVSDYEFIPRYTGYHVFRKITHVLRDMEGMLPGYCVISMEQISPAESIGEYLEANPETEEEVKLLRAAEIADKIQRRREFRGMVGDELRVNAPESITVDGGARARDPIPTGVYWSTEHGNFYSSMHVGMGSQFGVDWYQRRGEFPQDREALKMREYLREHPHPGPIPERLPAKSTVTHHENGLLLHLTQEAGEVIQAITKLQFFGKETVVHRGVSYNNTKALGLEIGNLQHMIHVVTAAGLVDESDVKHGIAKKLAGLDKHLTKK